MALDSIIDPFHRDLVLRLQEELEKRKSDLAKGGAARNSYDFATTAEKYAAAVAYMQALSDIMAVAAEIEQRRYAPNQNNDDDGGFA